MKIQSYKAGDVIIKQWTKAKQIKIIVVIEGSLRGKQTQTFVTAAQVYGETYLMEHYKNSSVEENIIIHRDVQMKSTTNILFHINGDKSILFILDNY